jgi:hypothetical protein
MSWGETLSRASMVRKFVSTGLDYLVSYPKRVKFAKALLSTM